MDRTWSTWTKLHGYLLPTLLKERQRFHPKPMQNAQALRLFHEILLRRGVPGGLALKLALGTMRICAPNVA